MEAEKRSTEQRNPRTYHFDQVSTLEMVQLMNSEDKKVAEVVKNNLVHIAKLIDEIYNLMKKGGRLIYIGAGTSGRLGILDASEIPPTFGVENNLIQGIIAGGSTALQNAVENAEDDKTQAIQDLKEVNLNENDFLIGIASSGTTPYVFEALRYAKSKGINTGSITCTENNMISQVAKFPIELITGPEVITGSTRLKAGTAQKLVLNMISTCIMTKMGKVYSNYMVDLKITNKKLYQRATNMLMDILEISQPEAQDLLQQANENVKAAIVMKLVGVSYTESVELINKNNGKIREVVEIDG
ncbi:N-acetylmuramic acid 6-phosphate etherase [Facklamia miroungae]|uniref:N-acetylmuramic acid 6-phosphate etherase n=2 Tax=Facklamia miroungae TaxID=120956 RepID=A0A1G7RZT1_9LACT|nr:N-acetylmuramic acid 6-phosphate etherase [Facklamia miroungae]SDG15330.1 N-acetylmuramic acid 6-phosphate etherase [Facklamia miroungae]